MRNVALFVAAVLLVVVGLRAQAPSPAAPQAASTPPPAPAPAPPSRFAQVNLKLLTVGEQQPMTEAGAFGASLPLGRPGHLERVLMISNVTRGSQTSVPLSLTLTASVDEAGTLHCFTVSELLLPEGAGGSRAKDLVFAHPGDQVMEVFADPITRVRVILSVSAHLIEEPVAPAVWPLLRFGVRVEQWLGGERRELESLQLQSLDGRPVSHDYTRRIPRWVEGKQGETVLEDLPVLDLKKEKPTLQAGQGFTIDLKPAPEGEKPVGAPPRKRDGRIPPPAAPVQKVPEGMRSLVWDEEYYKITIVPLQLSPGGMRVRVLMEGRTLDPRTGLLDEKNELAQEKEVLSEQPFPIYLTRETPDGPRGFLAWVLPAWEAGTP